MNSNKRKHYKKPALEVHGNFEKLTRNGAGTNYIDVPFGTGVGIDGDINSVTS